jgi:electron transfer flavoprotein beta subunit
MNHVVCIAYVPDTETKIKIGADGRSIDESDVKWIVSPYDEYALEEAIKTKEAKGGTVTVVTFGPPRADVGLRECLARGADEVIRIASEGVGDIDSLGVAELLAAEIKTLPHDVIWMGNKGVGTDAQLLPPMLAELLDVPHVNLVTHLEWKDGGGLVAHREIEGSHEVFEAPFPVVVGAQKGLNEPRYASLKGIMAAKKKAITTKSPADLGVDLSARTGDKASVRWIRLELPPPRQAVRLIPADDPAKAAEELLHLLRDEAKVL